MATHRDCDRTAGDIMRQLPQSQRRSLFDSKHLALSDDVTTDSESILSDEKDIFDAIVVPTRSRDSRGYESPCQMGPIREEGLAAKFAMFIPTSSSASSPPLTVRPYGRKKERKKLEPMWWRHQALSDQYSNRSTQRTLGFNEISSLAEAIESHRKATSLETIEPNERTPNWPGKPGPAVVPNQPRYSPPERRPTPPGLPSFNTPEAVQVSAQFLTEQHGGRFYAQHNAAGAEQGSSSYGTTFRRLLGLPSSVDGRGNTNTHSVVGIGRADDGTIVYGRFPYRQSGHNANMARQLHEHQFFQDSLPILEVGESVEREEGSTKNGGADSQPPRRRPRGYVPPSRRLWSFHDGLPMLGSSARSRSGISDRSRSFCGMTRPSSRPDEVRNSQSTSRHAAEAAANHIHPHHSQFQSVQTNDNDDDNSNGHTIIRGTHSGSEIFSWLPLQLCFCCLSRACPFQESRGGVEGLQNTASHETYVTAHSRPSASTTLAAENQSGIGLFGKIEVPRWLSEAWTRVSPYVSPLSRAESAVRSS
ncbi:hypothetical protein F1880_004084 [Penicillium rolfsii]|nr:hypothetical protein F1880_004084 [Penicillium rolfsii]